MKHLSVPAAAIVAFGLFTGSASAANLLGYYPLEGDYRGTVGPAAAPAMNPDQLSFVAGFRGQAVNISDPDEGANTGGSFNIPINANPSELPDVSFGGWVNVNAASEGHDGFMSTDNGGWDRGITMNSDGANNAFGIASGAAPSIGAARTPGSWQYVVGTFSRSNNRSTLYVGDAILGNVSTVTVSGVDANEVGELVIEVGRYDNQDFNGLVDEVFVFGDELDIHQANAIRNLRLSLDLSPEEAAALFNLYDAGGAGAIGGYNWSTTGGFDGANPGAVLNVAGGYGLVLGDGGAGLMGTAVPEPSATLLAAFGAFALLFRRRR